jgi:hypothetical protein
MFKNKAMSEALDHIETGRVVWVLDEGETLPVEKIWSQYTSPQKLVLMSEHIRLRGEQRRKNREYFAAHPNELAAKKRGHRFGRESHMGSSFVRY